MGSAGVGLVIAGLIKLPLVSVLAVRAPRHELPGPRTSRLPWSDVAPNLRQSPQLRAVALQAVGMGLFVATLLLMAVPVSQSLRGQDLFVGAGFLMASFAVGELVSPLVVRALQRGRTNVEAASWAVLLTGVALAAFGLLSPALSSGAELAA